MTLASDTNYSSGFDGRHIKMRSGPAPQEHERRTYLAGSREDLLSIVGRPLACRTFAGVGCAESRSETGAPERACPGSSNVCLANERAKLTPALAFHSSALRLVLRTQPRSGCVLEYPNRLDRRPRLRLPNILPLLGDKYILI